MLLGRVYVGNGERKLLWGRGGSVMTYEVVEEIVGNEKRNAC